MAIKIYPKGSQLVAGGKTFTGHVDLQAVWDECFTKYLFRSNRAKELKKLAEECKETLHIIGDTVESSIQGGGAYAAFDDGKGVYTHVFIWDPATELKYDPGGKWVKVKADPTKARYMAARGAKPEQMPVYITLAHELGHFEQYLTRTDWYLKHTKALSTDIDKHQGKIEADNLARNEIPICTELGLRVRNTYYDDNGKVKAITDLNRFGVTIQ